jgi:Sec-independent protein translocase protein TatA
MTEYVHLVGTEQVQSAANSMREAAHEMRRAANEISEAMHLQQRTLQETNAVLTDLVLALENMKP